LYRSRLELHTKAGVPLHQCGIEDVKTFQRFLVGYQIHVISREHFNGIVYHGPTAEMKIYLYYRESFDNYGIRCCKRVLLWCHNLCNSLYRSRCDSGTQFTNVRTANKPWTNEWEIIPVETSIADL
jgi:hypothetical protein